MGINKKTPKSQIDMRDYIILHKIFILLMLTSVLCGSILAQDKKLVVRIAKLQIDSALMESYKMALKEEIETSVRVEPGVLALYAVADKSNPFSITIFEIYANEDAYNSHRETAHFKKYKTTAKEMVKSLELLNVVPIALEAKKELKLE
jgi:quinol monooxygenase YgiN